MKNKQKSIFIIVFLLPCIIMWLLIYAYPLANIIVTSFCNWNYKNFTAPEFPGVAHMFDNYIKLFTLDNNFKMGLINSLKWVVLTLIVQVPFTLLVALVLSKKPRGWRFTRNAFVIPNIISSAAIGLIFMNLYSPSRGIVTEICNFFVPGSNVSVLTDSRYAFWGVTFSFILYGGTNCILLLTQIFSIDPSMIEAAKVDGASNGQIDTKIIMPLLRPMIGTVAVLAANYGLLLYNEIALITRGARTTAHIPSATIFTRQLSAARNSTLPEATRRA